MEEIEVMFPEFKAFIEPRSRKFLGHKTRPSARHITAAKRSVTPSKPVDC